MELFTKATAVKLRSHLDNYLVADDDKQTVRQSRNGSSRKATWFVEIVQAKSDVIRLRSCHDKYLTASDKPFLLGMTGHKVLQTVPYEMLSDWDTEWEPIRDGFQVKIKSWCGKYLRANGGTPPWRNSVTHDEPHGGVTKNWVLWDVEDVETDSLVRYLSSMSSFSCVSEDVLEAAAVDGDGDGDDRVFGSEPGSPVSVVSFKTAPRLTMISSMSRKLASKQAYPNQLRSVMEFFRKAKAVRLRGHHDKYLHVEEGEESVTQDRNGSSKNASWAVEFVPGSESIIRLKSCYGKYLTASNQPFLLGMTGRKVILSLPRRLDSSLEWEPIREGSQVKLKTRYGNFLRANGGLPPWRNSVTHDIPHRSATQDWILWDVEVVETLVQSPDHHRPAGSPVTHSVSSSPSSVSTKSGNLSGQESSGSYSGGSPPKSEGRTIYYHVADESGEVDDDVVEGYSFNFKANGVEELTKKLGEETGLEDIIVCTRSPLNGKLYPLRLQLPPNNADMHVIIVQSSAKAARDFGQQGFPL